ncbi:MAG: hypothetical protein HY774_29325 [Acidobacteria bacterium]|nr:hypothetical protein [Acidobacteriota bacterium]
MSGFEPRNWAEGTLAQGVASNLPPGQPPPMAAAGRVGKILDLTHIRWWRVQSDADHRLTLLHPFGMRTKTISTLNWY